MGNWLHSPETSEEEVEQRGNDYSKLSNDELLALREETVKKVSKFSNFQMARKIQLNSLYGALGNQP